MEKDKPQIEIPESGGVTAPELKRETDSRFKDLNYILLSVVIILIVMVATLVIDSFRFNSAIYKEYSQKTESVETTQKTNEALLNQIKFLSEQNKQEMEIIKQLLKNK
jgi:uncharacterized protein YpmS